ncbi:MAG: 2-polyprenyl-3-methyl-5-hydroxy-6-metoxy-1,4-benzoquinol methylase, partial [Planctomycetota bacterium]
MNQSEVDVIHLFESETWSRCASSYLDTFSGLTSQMLPKLIEATGVSAGLRVLDLGCGPGNSSRAFKDAGAEVVG